MALDLQTFRVQVDSLLSAHDDELSRYRRELQIKAAVELYGIERPDEVVEDVTGDGGRYYPLTGGSAVLSAYVEGHSRILSIEYPAQAVSADHDPQMLDPAEWDDRYRDASVRYLRLDSVAPSVSDTMRIRFTAPYAWTVTTATQAIVQTGHGFSVNDWIYYDTASSTWAAAGAEEVAVAQVSASADEDNFVYKSIQADIPLEHFHAVCYLACSLICTAISSKYSRTSDSTIGADSVNHTSRAAEFASRSRDFRKQYEQQIQRGEANNVKGDGYALFIDTHNSPDWPAGRQYLFRGRR